MRVSPFICNMNGNKRILIVASVSEPMPLTIEILAKGKIAQINIKGNINNWRNSSSEIESQIQSTVNKGAKTASIYINSGGGDVFEANEILNLIAENFEDVSVTLGALCASAATIFIAKYPTTAKKNTKIMIHKPSVHVSGNEDKLKSTLKLLQGFTYDYKKMYANKMKLTEKEVEDLWAKGDYWLTAKEALKKGLIDAIEDDNAKIDAETRMQLVACGAPNIPKQNPKEDNIMDKLELIALLGLDPTATDAEITAKIKANRENAEKTAALEAKAKTDSETVKAEKIKNLLDNAEKDKKIDATQRSNYEILAKADFDNTKKVIDAMQPIAAISKQLENGGTPTAEQSKWTYKDYQENNAMASFEKLPEDKKTALIDAHYKE